MRSAAALAVATLALATVVAGCSSEGDDATETTGGGITTTSATGSGDDATATSTDDAASEPATGSGTATGDDGGDTGDALPTVPADWADATFAAWKAGDTDTLGTLATGDAVDVLTGRPWTADDGWDETPTCDGAAGSTYCQFLDGAGDEALVLRVSNQAVDAGDPAVIEARFGAPVP